MNEALTQTNRQQQNNRLSVTMDERSVNNPCLSFVYSTTRMNKKKTFRLFVVPGYPQGASKQAQERQKGTLVCPMVIATVVSFSFDVPFSLHLFCILIISFFPFPSFLFLPSFPLPLSPSHHPLPTLLLTIPYL